MINIKKIKEITEQGKSNNMSPSEFTEYKEKMEKNALITYDALQSFANSNFSRVNLGILLEKYNDYKQTINDFYYDGGLYCSEQDKINVGFQKTNPEGKNVNAIYHIENFMSKMQQVYNSDWTDEDGAKNRINQDINKSDLFEYNEESYSREINLKTNPLSGEYLNKAVYFLNKELKEEVSNVGGELANLNPKSLFMLYYYGVLETINHIDNQNSEEFKKANATINKIVSSEINKVDESNRKDDKKYELFLEDGSINKDFKKYYDLMKTEKDTSWLKSNIQKLEPKILLELGIYKNPAVDFSEEIFKDIKNKDFDLDTEIELATHLFKDENIKQSFTKKDMIEYIKQDFPDPVIFKCMVESLNKEELYANFNEKYNFTEEILSHLIGEESSCTNMNENKMACLVNLMNHNEFDMNKKLTISTSKNLSSIINDKHENLYKDEEHPVEMNNKHKVLSSSISNQLCFKDNNKITIMDFLGEAQDHLITQNINSNYDDHNKEETLNKFLTASVTKDWHDLLKGTIPKEDFNATKLKQKILNVSNYFNSLSGPICSMFGFIGVLGCALFLGAAKIMENNQNNKIKDQLNNLSKEQKLRIDEIKTTVNQNGDIEVSAISGGEEFPIGVGKSCGELREVNKSNLPTTSTQKNLFFDKLKGLKNTSVDPSDFKAPVGKILIAYKSTNAPENPKNINEQEKPKNINNNQN